MNTAIRATDLREGEQALTKGGDVVDVLEIRVASGGKVMLARVRHGDGSERTGFASAYEAL